VHQPSGRAPGAPGSRPRVPCASLIYGGVLLHHQLCITTAGSRGGGSRGQPQVLAPPVALAAGLVLAVSLRAAAYQHEGTTTQQDRV
jgi:hypothetical protein